MDSIQQEQDLKLLLKQLFIEKKKVRELENRLKHTEQELPPRKFFEQQTKLQSALAEKEQAIALLQQQLGKARPALKQLFDQLQEAKHQLKLKENLPDPVDPKELELKEEELKLLKNELKQLQKEIEKYQHELGKVQDHEKKEIQRFENERARLVEKLAESLSQHQRQNETVKDLHEEINRLRQSNLEIKQHLEKGQQDLEALIEQKQRDASSIKGYQEKEQRWEAQEEALQSKLVFLEARLSESDIAAIHEDYSEKLHMQKEELTQKVRLIQDEKEAIEKQSLELAQSHEKTIQGQTEQIQMLCYKLADITSLKEKLETESKNFIQQIAVFEQEASNLKQTVSHLQYLQAEKEQEIRQAQQHLAKKVKETTLLRDLSDEQKVAMEKLQEELVKLQAELQQSKQALQLQKLQEEKLQLLVEQWQDKFKDQSSELAQVKQELANLLKIKRQYDEMATKLTELKVLLGKNSAAS